MTSNTSHEHHYVPRFILRRWRLGGVLHGYYWDEFKNDVRVKKKGVGGFCHELDLLSLQTTLIASDALESQFFGHVDDVGAKVASKLVVHGLSSLMPHERPDFARLLLSLDARRPANVTKLKRDGANYLKEGLDNDPVIIAAMIEQAISGRPSKIWEQVGGAPLNDRSLLIIQNLVDNRVVGSVLINASWRVYHIGRNEGSLLLSDRPLIRIHAYDHPNAIWVLPLTPQVVFVAANSKRVIQNFDRQTPRQLRKRVNEWSVNQIERYVFVADESNMPLVTKRLRQRFLKSPRPRPPRQPL